MGLFSLVKKGTEMLKQKLKEIKCQAKPGNASGNKCPRKEVIPPSPDIFSSKQHVFLQVPGARSDVAKDSLASEMGESGSPLCWDLSKWMVT